MCQNQMKKCRFGVQNGVPTSLGFSIISMSTSIPRDAITVVYLSSYVENPSSMDTNCFITDKYHIHVYEGLWRLVIVNFATAHH